MEPLLSWACSGHHCHRGGTSHLAGTSAGCFASLCLCLAHPLLQGPFPPSMWKSLP